MQARGVLRVGMSGDYAPFCLCSEAEDSCAGFEVDAAHRLAVDLGVGLEIVRFRWPELRQDLEAGKFDVAMSGVTMRPERLLFAAFSRPYAVAGAVVLVADQKRLPTITAVNQPGVRVAVNAGGHLEQVARARFTAATIITTPKNLSLPDLVAHQQADAVLTDSFEAPQFLAAHGQFSALPAFGRDRKAYLVRRSDMDLRARLDQWLKDREQDGFLTALRQRWLGASTASPLPSLATLFALLDLRLALMPAVAEYKLRAALPIEDLTQEAAVIAQAATLARTQGKNPEAIQGLFRVQIDLAKQVQQSFVNTPDRIPRWARGLELGKDLRPALSDLGEQIISTVAQISPVASQGDISRLAEEEITTEGITVEGKRRLGEAAWRAVSAPSVSLTW